MLPQLLQGIKQPVIVFLNAHYSGGTAAKADDICDLPVLQELAYLKTREYDDIIIVDDVGYFNIVGGSEPETKPEDGVVWPQFAYNWCGITKEKMLAEMKSGYQFFTNKDSRNTVTPRED